MGFSSCGETWNPDEAAQTLVPSALKMAALSTVPVPTILLSTYACQDMLLCYVDRAWTYEMVPFARFKALLGRWLGANEYGMGDA